MKLTKLAKYLLITLCIGFELMTYVLAAMALVFILLAQVTAELEKKLNER